MINMHLPQANQPSNVRALADHVRAEFKRRAAQEGSELAFAPAQGRSRANGDAKAAARSPASGSKSLRRDHGSLT
jgi:hypothetical protein